MRHAFACSIAIALVALAPRALAQGSQSSPARGFHARAHLAATGDLSLPLGGGVVLAGGGGTSGVDLAVHPNHDVGLRGYVTALGGGFNVGLTWQAMLSYRFHDDIVVDRVAPYLELAAGIGMYEGCVSGDFCGGFGPAFTVGGGVEYALHRYFALIAGGQILAQTGMANGVSLVLVPGVVIGARAG